MNYLLLSWKSQLTWRAGCIEGTQQPAHSACELEVQICAGKAEAGACVCAVKGVGDARYSVWVTGQRVQVPLVLICDHWMALGV